MLPPVTVIVPNFDGLHLMKANIPPLLAALRSYEPGGEIVVVDDGSSDGSPEWLRAQEGPIRSLFHRSNRGFAAACTTGIRAAENDFVILLNTDVEATAGFIAPLARALEPEDVFAAGCLALKNDGVRVCENVKIPYFRMEKLRFHKLRDITLEEFRRRLPDPIPSLFASGGFMALKAGLFERLGGFDPLFEPFYFEDVDLCYRAWKRGYRVIFEPRSVVVHRHFQGSILAHYGQKRADAIMERNRLLFAWKNFTSPRIFWLRHMTPLVIRILSKWILLDGRFYHAFLGALRKRRQAAAGRAEEKRDALRSDEDVFRILRRSAPPGLH